MTTQLALYNGALLELGERRLSALTEETESRRALDDAWENGSIKDYLLSQGLWNWAMRTVELTYDPSVTPSFGYQYGFEKPTDWIRTAGVSVDEAFAAPLNDYVDEQGYWFCDHDTLYVRYVSNDASYGYDMSQWSPNFIRWVHAYLAYRVALRVTGSREIRNEMFKMQDRLLVEARSRDAMNEAAGRIPAGSWVRSRYADGAERGKKGQLIG